MTAKHTSSETSISRGLDVMANQIIEVKLASSDTSINRGLDLMTI
jgi:hypothetical protein